MRQIVAVFSLALHTPHWFQERQFAALFSTFLIGNLYPGAENPSWVRTGVGEPLSLT